MDTTQIVLMSLKSSGIIPYNTPITQGLYAAARKIGEKLSEFDFVTDRENCPVRPFADKTETIAERGRSPSF